MPARHSPKENEMVIKQIGMKYCSALALLTIGAIATGQEIQVEVDGRPVKFGATKPIRQNGRVLVPIRGIFESLNASVNWNSSTRTVSAMKGNKEIMLFIGNRTAKVDGLDVMLDTPAQIIGGSTLVPLRFVSEALGADVKYMPDQMMVAITTGEGMGSGENFNNGNDESMPVPKLIEAYTVLPISLNQTLSSTDSKKGDKFTAIIQTTDEKAYGGIPLGSYIEGHVSDVRAKKGSEPGVLDLSFDRIRLPNGKTTPLAGSLYSLDSEAVDRDADGVMTAKNKNKDNRIVYAGYGAGAGVLVGLLSGGKLSLEKALLGGLLGYVIGSAEKPKQNPSDVKLARGTLLGVRLNEDLALKQ